MKTMNRVTSIIYFMAVASMLFMLCGHSTSGKATGLPQQNPSIQLQPNLLIVKPKPSITTSNTIYEYNKHGFTLVKIFEAVGNIQVVRISQGMSVESAIEILQSSQIFEFVEPNSKLRLDQAKARPNDMVDTLWGLDNNGQNGGKPDADIDAPEAWNVHNNSEAVIVAVIDTGIDYRHEDLSANMWVNKGEIPGDGIDNDGNGYIDDVHGINAITGTGDPFDDHGHGSHCAGTIGATGNNGIGIVGVNWNVRLMALKFLDSSGSGWTVDAIACIDYAIKNKAQVLSNSWGGGVYRQSLYNSIKAANDAGIVFVAAAGNSASNNDVIPSYPASYNLPNIVSVAASDNSDNIAPFSNYGRQSVDLAAPGVDIYSTLPNNRYGTYSGTSMAAPHVTGVIALLKAYQPQLTITELIDRVVFSADIIPSLSGKVASNGRLNAYKAIMNQKTNPTPPVAPGNLALRVVSMSQIDLVWGDNSDNENGFVIQRSINGRDYSEINKVSENNTVYSDMSLTTGTKYWYRVQAYNSYGNSAFSNVVTETTPSVPRAPGNLLGRSPSGTQVNLTWTDNSTNETGFRLERSVNGVNFSLIAAPVANQVSFSDVGLIPGTTYWYKILAVNAQGSSGYSNVISIKPDTAELNPPASLSVTGTAESQIIIQWTDRSSSETGFVVERKTGASASWGTLATVGPNVTTYKNLSLNAETVYVYRVYAISAQTRSVYSNEVSGKTSQLRSPNELSASVVSLSQINLQWNDNSTAEESFQIQRRTTGNWSTVGTVSANTVRFNCTGLTTNTTYYFRVVAISATSTSTASSEVKGSTVLIFQSESHAYHQTGRLDGDGWSVRVGDPKDRAMNFGPYTTAVNPGQRTATFRLMIDNRSANNDHILTIDVYDANSDRVIASRKVTRGQFSSASAYQNFDLSFTAQSGQRLEFRTFWHGGAYVRQDYASVY